MDTSIYYTDKAIKVPYEDIVKQNEVGIVYLNCDVITYANKSFLQIFNATSEEVIGVSLYNFIAPVSRGKLEEAIAAMKKGESDNFSDNLQMITDGDEESYFSLHLSIHSKTEDSISLIGASRNSTTRVKKMEELLISKSTFDSLYTNIVDGIVIYDYFNEKAVDCNSSALRIFDYETKEELLKYNRFQFVPKFSPYFPGIDCHERTKDDGLKVMSGEAFRTAGAFIKRNGEHIIVHANVVPTFRNYGEAFIIFQDSTKRVLQKQAQKAVEKQYKDIFQNSHEGIVYTDLNTKQRIMCNDKALQLFGVSNFEELKSLTPVDFFIDELNEGLSPNEFFKSKIEEAAKKGKAEVSIWLKKQTGEIIRVVVVMVLDKSDPKNPKIISFMRDVTNLYNSEVKLKEKNEELETYISANLQLENFAYFASHDLQTPLRGIISFTQLLKRSLKGKLAPIETEYMDFIIGSSKNMRNLVMDILSYSKVNTADINLDTIDLNSLITELCKEMGEDIKDKNAIVNLNNIPSEVKADEIKLKQLFQNLISNAIKFSIEGKQPEVSVSCIEKEDHWLFKVSDNGIGINPEYFDKIFMIFKRLNSKEEYEGTGIGLAMVKKIVEQHQGEIWVDSVQGAGTTFSFTIKKNPFD